MAETSPSAVYGIDRKVRPSIQWEISAHLETIPYVSVQLWIASVLAVTYCASYTNVLWEIDFRATRAQVGRDRWAGYQAEGK